MKYPVTFRQPWWLAALLLTAGLAAFWPCSPAQAGQYVINSLPHTISQSSHSADLWDTVTIAGTKLRTDSSGITFNSCHHWVLLLDRDTIVFGTDSTVNIDSYWVYVNGVQLGSCHDMVIKGGYILHEPDNARSDETVFRTSHLVNDQNRGIQIGGPTYNILIDSVREVRVRGHANLKGTHSIWITNEAYNVHIRNSRLFNDVFAYENRGWFSSTCIRAESMEMSRLTNANDYHVWVENCYLEDNAHTAMYMTDGEFIIEGDTVVVDARNQRYLTSDGNAEHGTANAYGVQFYGVCTGTVVKNCVFLAGNRYKGGRGIQLERTSGTQSEPIVICSTYVNSHEAACVAFTGAFGYYPCAIKVRNASRWVNIYDNQFIYVGDGSVPVGWTGLGNPYYRYGHAVIYSQITFDAVATPPYGVTFERNLMRSIDRAGGGLIEAVCFDKCLTYDDTFIWRYNRVESDSIGYRFGGYDGDGIGIHIYADTLKLVDTSTSGHLAWQVGFQSNRRGSGIVATDMSYEDTWGSPADYDTSIAFSFGMSDDICLRRTLKVYVRGNNGLPVTNASVTVTNNYGQTVVSGLTDNGGRVMGTVTGWFESRVSVDSMSFNNFQLSASRSGDNANKSFTLRWNDYKDTLTLAATTGDGVWRDDDDDPPDNTDITGPGPILDLGAVCDPELSGSVLLTWTATGDDGSTGIASRYDVRYSSSAITAGNFASATALANPPQPRPAGMTEEWSVSLTPQPGQDLFFAVRAFDEADNGSNVSNSAPFDPGSIHSPVADTVLVDEENRIVTLVAETTPSCVDSYFQFQVDTVSGFSGPLTAFDNGPDETAQASFAGLLDNTVYYWRCRAIATDETDTSSFTATRAFMPFVDLSTGCDDFAVQSPGDGVVVPQLRPTLVVTNMNTDAGNVYFFELDDDSSFSELVSNGVVDQQDGGFTSWVVPVDLVAGSTYYWRTEANACGFNVSSSFLVAAAQPAPASPACFAFPNPFNPDASTPLTFANLPEDNSLTIMTVSGDVVRFWDDVPQEIQWDGTNQSGNLVSSGVYMWFTDPAGDKGKLIIVR